jgi:argininosuccinate lyase
MSTTQSIEARKFVEGVGGRLTTSKSETYARAVLGVEQRNNEYIGKYMLAGDLACVLSANELGVTPDADAKALVKCLCDLLPQVTELSRTQSIGDIVVSRELWVVNAIGNDAGSWLHVGRNRAESLRGSLPRMFFRDVLFREQAALERLVRALVGRAEPTMTSLAPFYHHLQHAGRTSLGEYLLSFAASFNKHFDRLDQADDRLDLAPPPNTGRPIVVDLINRVGKRLGFSKVGKIWQELFITEEHFTEPVFVMTQISVALARLAEDLRLFMTSEFAFFELADEHASGSSGRPQKKNPFGLQAVINGAAVGSSRLAGQFATNITVSEEADSTYHAYHLYQFCEDVIAWTDFMAEVIERGDFKLDELEKKSADGFAGAREALDILVYEHKVPYRYAHRVCGEMVRTATEGADEAALVAQTRTRLADFPGVDAVALVRVAMGQSTDAVWLNVEAFNTVRDEINQSLTQRVAAPRSNVTQDAIDALVAEGRRFAG